MNNLIFPIKKHKYHLKCNHPIAKRLDLYFFTSEEADAFKKELEKLSYEIELVKLCHT